VPTIDPSFGVGWPNYSQTGSFFAPVSPPALGPFEGTLVALPCINYDWLRLLLGASDQLRNPSTWKNLTDAQMVVVLSQVEELQAQLSIAGPCVICPEMRLQDCILQISCDSGATWTDVSGWADNFGPCVQSAAIITTPPANPGDRTTDQMACSIAGYLTDQVITVAMQAAVDNINANRNLLQLGVDLALVIPEFVLVGLFVNAVADFYTFFSSMTVSDFENALVDASLFSQIRCAIYNAIATDGHLTSANFPTVLSNVCGISYSPSDVIDAICAFLTTAGFPYVNQLSQGAGLNPYDDCSDCASPGTWCYRFDFVSSAQGWDIIAGAFGTYNSGHGWQTSATGSSPAESLRVELVFPIVLRITNIVIDYNMGTVGDTSGGLRLRLAGSTVFSDSGMPATDGDHSYGVNLDQMADRIWVSIDSGTVSTVTAVALRGVGENPFGPNNC